jgi:ATP-dependent DNA ligase
MTSEEPEVLSRDPRTWRPLEAKKMARAPAITDPIIEPLWQGTRVLAHFHATPNGPRKGTVELRDADGFDVTTEFPEVVEALIEAIFAVDAVVDGILTDQATAGGMGVGVVPEAQVSQMGVLLGRPAEVSVEASRDRETSDEIAFIALDLLSVDGEALLDLPLLERKRQLEGLFCGNEYARVSPFARPPLAQWFNSWKSAGFRGVVLKAANSRYHPADVAKGWAIVERVGQR